LARRRDRRLPRRRGHSQQDEDNHHQRPDEGEARALAQLVGQDGQEDGEQDTGEGLQQDMEPAPEEKREADEQKGD
jgi:hypothetical protein